ncbi:MAG: response regulator, partial [Bacteroidota bacterium]
MIRFLIVDDEPLAHNIIEKYAAQLPHLTKVGNCHDAIEAIGWLNQQETDLIFLDINMPKLQGLDFLRTLRQPPAVIVTTAYKEYAIEGYELNVVDY